MIIGDVECIKVLHNIKQNRLINFYKELFEEPRVCPICENSLSIVYVSEDTDTIRWACENVCKRCQHKQCDHTETTDLQGNRKFLRNNLKLF